MPEKFLILGCNSFYARHFVEVLKARGDEMTLSRHYTVGDGFDYIVNFASKSSVVESWEHPDQWARANVEDFGLMINAINGRKLKRFIHVSTPEVYGSTPHWVEEDCFFNPTTPYAVTRAAGDMLLKAFHRAYGFPAVITRTANIYGPGQQDYRIIPKAINHKREGKVLPLHGGGWSRRSFIHIRDACEATYLLCKEGKLGETYHISTREWHWIRDVVEMVGCKYEDVEDRLGKDEAYLLDSTKIRELGWNDTISLEEGIRELSI